MLNCFITKMNLEESELEVEITTPLLSTENKERVIFCLNEIFPGTEWVIKEEEIKGETNSLERFKKILKDRKIRDTARSYMLGHIIGDECKFTLSKQASCGGAVNFSEEEQPLGGIDVTIRSDNIREVIEEITKINK